MTFDGKGGGVDHDYLTSMGGGLLMTIDDKLIKGAGIERDYVTAYSSMGQACLLGSEYYDKRRTSVTNTKQRMCCMLVYKLVWTS